MPSLLIVIFAVEAAVRLIDAVGAAAINNLVRTQLRPLAWTTESFLLTVTQLWTIINYLPISTSQTAAQQRKAQTDYLAVRSELNATSSQDEFAKWAKLRRKHDKLLEQLEAISTFPHYIETHAHMLAGD